MSTIPTWAEMKRRLAASGRPPRTRPAAAFWDTFRAALPLHPQRVPGSAPSRPLAQWLWASSGACAALLAVVAVWHGLPSPANAEPATGVRSYEVLAPHGAVMILHDATTDATILWVSGVPTGSEKES